MRILVSLTIIALLLLSGANLATAQLPTTQLGAITPAGGRPGSTFHATIAGDHLDDVNRLVFSDPGISATLLPLAEDQGDEPSRTAKRTFAVTIADHVSPGIHDARIAGRYGLSNPRAFVVGTLEPNNVSQPGGAASQPAKTTANHTFAAAYPLPLGSVSDAQVAENHADYYRFTAKRGERLLLECHGTRIDSRIDATLVLYDATGKELARVRDHAAYDPVLAFQVPADGEYVVEVYDFLYRGGHDYFYRLSLSRRPFIEAIYPPTVQPGESGEHIVYGYHLPGGTSVSNATGVESPLEMVTTHITAPASATPVSTNGRDERAADVYIPSHATMLSGFAHRVASKHGSSNALIVGHAVAPVTRENGANDTAQVAQEISLPAEYVGQFEKIGDEDWIAFEATPGETVTIEAISHRAGGNTDPTILVQEITRDENGQEKVRQLKNVDDDQVYVNRVPNFEIRSRDPSFEFVAKEGARYRVMIRDVYNMTRGDVRMTYRLLVGRSDPDFRLVAHADPYRKNNAGDLRLTSLVLPPHGTTPVNVHVFRRFGFDETIHITAEDLPPGVTCREAIVSGGATSAKLVFAVAENAPPVIAPIRIVGCATRDGEPFERTATVAHLMFDTENTDRLPPTSRAVRQMWISVTDKDPAPASVHLETDGKLLETAIGAQLVLPIRIERRGDFVGHVRVVPEGLPRQLRLDQLLIKGDNEPYNLKMRINNFPAGTFSIYMLGRSRAKFVRNAEAVATAEAMKKQLDQRVAQLEEASQAEVTIPELPQQLAEAKQQRQRAADKLKKVQLANKAEHTDFAFYSETFQIRVHATPVTLSVADTQHLVAAGSTLELPVKVGRRFGFGGQVSLELKPTNGITAKTIPVSGDQPAGTLTLQIDKSLTPGEYPCELWGQHVHGGLALNERQPVTITVTAPNDTEAAVAGK